MIAAIVTALAVAAAVTVPVLLHVWATGRPRHLTVIALDDNATADALAAALEQHLNAGGQLGDVLGYTAAVHPSGAVGVTLILAGDAAAGAEAILREAS